MLKSIPNQKLSQILDKLYKKTLATGESDVESKGKIYLETRLIGTGVGTTGKLT